MKLQVSRIWKLSWNKTHCKLLSIVSHMIKTLIAYAFGEKIEIL